MFPRTERLTAKRLFDKLFARGKRVRSHALSLVFLPATKQGKIGFIITKKVTKSAVQRNRMKRRVRAAFLVALQKPEHASLLQKNYMIVLIHRPILDKPFPELLLEVESLVTRMNQNQAKPRETKPTPTPLPSHDSGERTTA